MFSKYYATRKNLLAQANNQYIKNYWYKIQLYCCEPVTKEQIQKGQKNLKIMIQYDF